MYLIIKRVIASGKYELPKLLKTIDRYHVEDKISDEERDELVEMARAGAQPNTNPDDEIVALWAAIRALRAEVEALKSGGGTDEGGTDSGDGGDTETDADEYPEYKQPYIIGDAYQPGDKITENGEKFVCNHENTMHPPSVIPAYWDKVEA